MEQGGHVTGQEKKTPRRKNEKLDRRLRSQKRIDVRGSSHAITTILASSIWLGDLWGTRGAELRRHAFCGFRGLMTSVLSARGKRLSKGAASAAREAWEEGVVVGFGAGRASTVSEDCCRPPGAACAEIYFAWRLSSALPRLGQRDTIEWLIVTAAASSFVRGHALCISGWRFRYANRAASASNGGRALGVQVYERGRGGLRRAALSRGGEGLFGVFRRPGLLAGHLEQEGRQQAGRPAEGTSSVARTGFPANRGIVSPQGAYDSEERTESRKKDAAVGTYSPQRHPREKGPSSGECGCLSGARGRGKGTNGCRWGRDGRRLRKDLYAHGL